MGKKMPLTPLPPNQTQKPETGRVVHKESALLVNGGRVERAITKGDADQEPVQYPYPEPEKGLMLNHQPGLFCEVMQLHMETTLGRSCLSWIP